MTKLTMLGYFLIFFGITWWIFFDPWLRHGPKYLSVETQHFVLIAMFGLIISGTGVVLREVGMAPSAPHSSGRSK